METARNIIKKLLRGPRAERVGLMDNPWPETILAWVRQGYPTQVVHKEVGWQRWRPDDGRWVKTETPGEYLEPVPPWQYFSYDMAWGGGWFDIMPLRGVDELLEETDEWEVRRNGGGAALKYWKHKSGTPEHISFLMTSRESWEKEYRPHLLEWDIERLAPMDETRSLFHEARAAERWTYFGQQFIWENMRQTMGDVTLYENLLLDPEWIHDYCRVYTDLYRRYYTYLFETVGRPDGVWMYEDLGYKNGLFASPRVFRDLIFPYYKLMVDFFHQHGLPVILHSCGSTAQALPLIVETGFDALHPMERKARDNEPFHFAELFGDRLAFVGGLDVRVFETNDRDLIRREIVRYIDGMKERNARLVFASDHSIPPTVQFSTYQYVVDVYRERMMY